jgi:hypothetical protein
MMQNDEKLYQLALIILFVLVLIQLYNMYFCSNNDKEHMNAALLNNQYVDWPGIHDRNHIPPPQYQEPVFYKEPIYPKGEEIQLTNPIPIDTDLKCGPQFDWLVPHSLGANGRYDDMLWAKTSPKMILRQDCLSCKDHSSDSKSSDSDSVSGLPSMNGAGLLESNML